MKTKLILAVIKNRNNRVVGYRFLDTKDKYVEDYALNSVGFVSYLKKNKDNIENGAWKPGHSGLKQLMFTNGTEKRYPVLDSETLEVVGEKNPLVVVAELRDGYIVSSPYGEMLEWTKDQVFDYAWMNGIANGKCSSSAAGSRFISSINEKYPFIDRGRIYPELKAREKAIKEAKKKKLIAQLEREQRVPVDTKEEVQPVEVKVIETEIQVFKNDLAKKLIEKDREASQDTASLEAQFSKEINDMKLTEEEEGEAVQGAEECAAVDESTQTYDDDFYKQLEPTFGGKDSVALLKYAIEVRNCITREDILYYVSEGASSNRYVPTLLTLLTIELDDLFRANSQDAEFSELCNRAIDPEVLKLTQRLSTHTITLDTVWDTPVFKSTLVADVVDIKSKYALPLTVLENRLAHYAFNTSHNIFGCVIEDGVVYYGDHPVRVPGYKLHGIGLDYITITDGIKLKKIRLNK